MSPLPRLAVRPEIRLLMNGIVGSKRANVELLSFPHSPAGTAGMAVQLDGNDAPFPKLEQPGEHLLERADEISGSAGPTALGIRPDYLALCLPIAFCKPF